LKGNNGTNGIKCDNDTQDHCCYSVMKDETERSTWQACKVVFACLKV
jgi:hypothetical protein